MRPYRLSGLLLTVFSILALLSCATTVGKPYEPESLDPYGFSEKFLVGVVPFARGRSWGMDITRHAQWLTSRAGRPRLVLAVDAANEPAISMYAALGFRAWDRRTLYLKIF